MTQSYILTGAARTTTAHQLKADFIQIHCPIRDRDTGYEGIYIGNEFQPVYRHHEAEYQRAKDETTRYIALTKARDGGLIICIHAKVLGPGYPNLTTADNIDHTLELVRETATARGCDFDTDHVRRNGEVLQLHVTEDIDADLTRQDYRLMNNLVQQSSTWAKDEKSNGICWTHKKTSTNADKVTLAVYNKGAQMANLKYNRTFMQANGIDPSTFEGKTRFEARFRSMASIKKHLGLWTIGVDDVLTLEGHNPVQSLIEQIFDLSPRATALGLLSLSEYEMVAVIEACGQSAQGIDWARVESIIRQYDRKNPTRRIRAYKGAYERYLSLTGKDTIRGMTGTSILLDAVDQINARWHGYPQVLAAA